MKRDYKALCEECRRLVSLTQYADDDWDDLYSDIALNQLLADIDPENANKHLQRTAKYVDLPHPGNRDVRGENDFAAKRLVAALYLCYDKMTDETKALIKTFLLERDFTSMYGSENHVFMMRIARYLAAQFYKEDFKQYNMTWQEALETDKKYIIDFIAFRAKYGMGEFDSAYLDVDVSMCAMLACYAEDKEVKNMASMGLDLLFIEALNNLDKNGYFAGAAGRTYHFSGMNTVPARIKKAFVDMCPMSTHLYTLAVVEPDEFIAQAYANRRYSDEVLEEKHLHSMYAWRTDVPDWAHIDKLHKAGSISKYTYLSDDYSIGGINRQCDYPVDDTEDYVYAHHQQVEWSLLIPGEDEADSTRIYTHHPGETDQHRYWTGDLKCCCSSTYANKDTLLTFYDIEKEDKLTFTHAFMEVGKFDRIERCGNRLFLRKGNVNVFMYCANEFVLHPRDNELISEGRKNAYVFRVEVGTEFDAFMEKYEKMIVTFDSDKMYLEFDGYFLTKEANGKVEAPQQYPYGYVYKSNFVEAKWAEGVVKVFNGDKTLVLDFVNNEKYVK